jgi:hypothetical protein
MVRAATLVTAVLAVLALGACGDDEGGGGGAGGGGAAAEGSQSSPRSAPRQVVADYLDGFRRKDFGAVCETLAPRGRGVLASLLPSGSRRSSCEDVAERVARESVPLKRVRIGEATVSGTSATVRIRSTDPPFDSGVLLAKDEEGWRIAYPPGLITKLETPPGVPEHKDEPGQRD